MALSDSLTSNPADNGQEILEDIDDFPRFDVVSDHSDHHYTNSNRITSGKSSGLDCFANVTTAVHKKIMQEWRILERHLPDSIFVRVYENRIDLLRAAIIGAAGTPYHDGLFFFDIAFPSDYPTRPPYVYYRSYGLRLNPNLYANGRVCLSLINTWSGKKCEKWNPKESTILQVLLSIQALVLNEKPYFNEPGYAAWPGRAMWEKKSMAYNEDVFFLSCKTMLFLVRRPPKNFQGFVKGHFSERAHAILSACHAYSSGKVMVGFYSSDGSGSSTGGENDVPTKVKGLIGKLYPELVATFSRTGASVGHFVEHLKVEQKAASYKADAAKKKKQKERRGVSISKILHKLKKVFGLKNRVKHMSCSSSSSSSSSSSPTDEAGE